MDGIPDSFIELDVSGPTINPFPNFWPDLYNECNGFTNTIYVNIEEDEDIDNGDLIGAFYTAGDGTLQCFDYNTYTSTTGGNSFFTLQICEGNDNGFNNGEEVIFLMYDVSEQLVYEVSVVYEYVIPDFGVFSDVFTTDPLYDGIWISSLSVIGVSGSVPDFNLVASAGDYSIQVVRQDTDPPCVVVDEIFTLNEPLPVLVDYNIDGFICNFLDESTGLVSSTPTGLVDLFNIEGGTPPYSYTWLIDEEIITYQWQDAILSTADFDNDGFFDDLSAVGSGLYQLIIVDDNGCEFVNDIIVDGSNLPLTEFDIDYEPITCLGGVTDLTLTLPIDSGVEPFVFSWFDDQGEELLYVEDFSGFIEIENLEEGLYNAYVSDSFGCSFNQIVLIENNPSGVIALFDPYIDASCLENEALVDFANCESLPNSSCIVNGTPPFTYEWVRLEDLDDDEIYETEINLIGYDTPTEFVEFGVYSFSVTDAAGCSQSTIFGVTPPEPIEFASLLLDDIVCPGDLATLSIELISGNPGFYYVEFDPNPFDGVDPEIDTLNIQSQLDFYINPETNVFNDSLITSQNATLLFNDVSIFNENDTIGVFYTGDNGITCGGSVVFNSQTVSVNALGESLISVAVWGDDSSTPELDDGFDLGEDMIILLQPVNEEIPYQIDVIDFDSFVMTPSGQEVPINSFDNGYAGDGLFVLVELEIGDEFSQGPDFVSEPLSGGDYYIEVYDGNGCSWSEFISIDPVDDYLVNIDYNNPVCDTSNNGDISIEIIEGASQQFGYTLILESIEDSTILELNNVPPNIINTFSDLNTGNYNIIIEDDNGCQFDTLLTLVVDVPEPVITTYNQLCFEVDDGVIDLCVDWFSQDSLIFEWINVVSGEIDSVITDEPCLLITDLSPSEYQINITSFIDTLELCAVSQENIFIEPAEEIDIVDVLTTNTDCEDGFGTVSIVDILGGNPPYDIDWQGVDTDFVPAGTHQVIVTDASGCQVIRDYDILDPDAVIVQGLQITNNYCPDSQNGAFDLNLVGGASIGDEINDNVVLQTQYNYCVFGPNSMENTILCSTGSSVNLPDLMSGIYTLIVDYEITYENGATTICSLANITEIEIQTELDPIEFDVVDPSSVDLWDVDFTVSVSCFEDPGNVTVEVANGNNDDYIYHWHQLSGWELNIDGDYYSNGQEWLNSDDPTIDGGVDITGVVGTNADVILYPSYYFVYVEYPIDTNGDGVSDVSCYSDTVLFNVESPPQFEVYVDDVFLECNGDFTSVSAVVFGGSDDDIDGDGLSNSEDPDIDGDGEFLNDECIASCNDDQDLNSPLYDDDIDNDGIPNIDDDYIGGTIYNQVSTNSSELFTNGLIYENEFGDQVDETMLLAGVYTVYSYDSNGCLSNIDEFAIIEPDQLSIDLSYDYNALGSDESVDGPISLLCYGDQASIIVSVSGGTTDYDIVCENNFGQQFDLESSMLSAGNYSVYVIDSQGCQESINFSIVGPPNQLDFDADIDNDGISGLLQYNDFHISCFGASDGVIEFFIPNDSGEPNYEIEVVFNGVQDTTYINIPPNSIESLTGLSAGVYDFIITDSNGCVFQDFVELVEPLEFSDDIEYIINASCDEETDGMIIIRTSGGNPPLNYTFDFTQEIYTTVDSNLIIYEDDYLQDVIVEEIHITESDILISDLPANSWHTISILDDDYSCLDGVVSYDLYVGSDDTNCLFIPDVFTPNGDGINDTWQIDGIDLYPAAQIRVFNRWGQIIYESEGDYTPWDGVSQINTKDQEIATYYYVIDLNINEKNYNGSVTIKR